MLNKKKNNKGFTLVELLVVIAIIGILAVVAVPTLFNNIEKGKVADLEGDISAIKSGALSYYADNSKYPTTNGTTGTKQVENLLDGEIEGLSNPFNGTYSLTTTATAGELKLVINNMNGLTEKGLDKLIKDLDNTTGSTTSISTTIIK